MDQLQSLTCPDTFTLQLAYAVLSRDVSGLQWTTNCLCSFLQISYSPYAATGIMTELKDPKILHDIL